MVVVVVVVLVDILYYNQLKMHYSEANIFLFSFLSTCNVMSMCVCVCVCSLKKKQLRIEKNLCSFFLRVYDRIFFFIFFSLIKFPLSFFLTLNVFCCFHSFTSFSCSSHDNLSFHILMIMMMMMISFFFVAKIKTVASHFRRFYRLSKLLFSLSST